MRDISKLVMFSFITVLSSLLAWHTFFPRPQRGRLEHCPAALPGGLDPRLLVVLETERPREPDPRKRVFLQDLEELMLAGRYQVLTAHSEAGRVPARCVAWSIRLTFGAGPAEPATGEAAAASLSILRYGQVVDQLREFPVADPAAASILPVLRRTLASRLELGAEPGRPASLHDPLSAGFRDRLRAMRHHAEGRAGLAATLLRQAIERDGSDWALDFRLGHVLGDWAREMQVASARPFWKGKEVGRRFETEARRMFGEARRHLDRSLATTRESSALAHYSRGRMWMLLGEKANAEADFAHALEIWPAFAEATRELARVASTRQELAALEPRILEALLLVDRCKPGLRADLLHLLGLARLDGGKTAGAAAAFEQALASVPVERRQFRLEVLDLLARTQAELGQTAAAESSRKAYMALVAAGGEIQAEAVSSQVILTLTE
jgi:tetratricopeptide (TPR) repeat protein